MDRTPNPLLALALLALSACSCGLRFEPTIPQNGPNLGLLPNALSLEWPAPPETDFEVFVRTEEDLGGPVTTSRVRLVIEMPLESIEIAADDVEIISTANMPVGSVVIRRGVHRVRISGGSYGSIVVERATAPSAFAEDITIERVRVDGGEPAIAIRGVRRFALVESHVQSGSGVALFVGDTAPHRSEHVSVVDSVLVGAERPALRFGDVERSAIVDSWLASTGLFSIAISGRSDWVASRNTLEGGGVSIGDASSDIGTVWFWVNTLYRTGQVAGLEPDHVSELLLQSNVIYADGVTCMCCGETPSSWTVRPNPVRAYRAPPSRPVRP